MFSLLSLGNRICGSERSGTSSTGSRAARRRRPVCAWGIEQLEHRLLLSTWGQEAKLIPSDAEKGDLVGASVGLYGDSALVGNPNGQSAAVFVRDSIGNWSQQGPPLTAGDGAANDRFGAAVALSGTTAIVGAHQKDDFTGAGYVFVRDSMGNWSQQDPPLTADDRAANDNFGWSVAIDGDTAVFGARRDDVTGKENAGSAYVFVRDTMTGTWSQQQKLTAGSDAEAYDEFGESVAVSGGTIVVGARNDDDLGEDTGSVYVFVRDTMTGTWSQQTKLTAASDAAPDDHFGASVAISGDKVVVGAPGDDHPRRNSGSGYVFVRDDPACIDPSMSPWCEQAKLTASDASANDGFGANLAIDGDKAIVAAPGSASAYVFEFDDKDDTDPSNDEWVQKAKLSENGAFASTPFGGSPVSISGETAVVGARLDDEAGPNAGAAHVFVREAVINVTDIAVTAVNAPGSVVLGDVVNVGVVVDNVGNQDVTSDITVSLTESPDSTSFTDQIIAGGLAAGASATVTFSWDTTSASLGAHTLTASHTFADDDATNNSNQTTVNVNEATAEVGVDLCIPDSGNPGESLPVTVTGSNFQDGATADFGSRIAVQSVSFVSPGQLDVNIKIHRRAASGGRDVTIINPDGSSGTGIACFTVNGAGGSSPGSTASDGTGTVLVLPASQLDVGSAGPESEASEQAEPTWEPEPTSDPDLVDAVLVDLEYSPLEEVDEEDDDLTALLDPDLDPDLL